MKIYKYLCIKYDQYLKIESTDERIIEWVITSVKQVIPTSEVLSSNIRTPHTPTGTVLKKLCIVNLHHLQGHDREVLWWIMEQLGLQGWEIFSVFGSGEYSNYFSYHFRLEVES